ncbi:hypothetical protein Tco_0266018 [Tanacetum coccineum]
MSRANPQATIVSKEQLIPRANRLVVKKKNQRVTSYLNIIDTMMRFVVGIFRHHKLYKPVSLTATIPTSSTIESHSGPRLNNSVLEVMRNNQINLFTKPSTSTDDLSDMDLKLKLLNKIHLNKSSRKDKAPMVHAQEVTHADQPQDQEDLYIQGCSNAGWFMKKLGSADAAKRRTTWFDLLLKLGIDQNENHILGPSTVAIAKKLKELI